MNSLEKTDQVIINLKVIATLQDGERLCLRNQNFSVYSPGWAQALYRWMNGETRWVNMDDIKTVMNDAIRILGTYINMVHHVCTDVYTDHFLMAVPTPQTSLAFVNTMARELKAATNGLENLKKTYSGDQLITATFDLLIERTMIEIHKAEETLAKFKRPDPGAEPKTSATVDTEQQLRPRGSVSLVSRQYDEDYENDEGDEKDEEDEDENEEIEDETTN